MRRALVAAFLCTACGHATATSTSTSRSTAATPATEPVGRATLSSTAHSDHIEWILRAGADLVCADETHCAAPGELTRWSVLWADHAAATLPSGVVVPRSLLTASPPSAQLDVVAPAAHDVHLTLIGRDMLVVSSEPLEVFEDLVIQTALSELDDRPSAELIRDIAAEVRGVLGPPEGPVFVGDASAPADGVVALDASMTADVLRVRLIGAWIGQEGWRRGLAQYTAWLVVGASQDELLARFITAYRAYRASAGIAPEESSTRAESGGVVAAFCADVELHARGSSIATELARAHDLSHLPPPVAASLANRVAFTNVIDVAPCLAPLAQELVAVRYESPSADALLRVTLDQDLRVVSGRGFFRRGDRIVAVAGDAIQDETDVAWALHSTEVGERFVVVVDRDGSTRRTWTRRPRVQDAPTALRFSLRPSGNSVTSLD